MAKDEYIPYGPEWEKEMNKMPKKMLIEWLRKSFIESRWRNFSEELPEIGDVVALRTKDGEQLWTLTRITEEKNEAYISLGYQWYFIRQ